METSAAKTKFDWLAMLYLAGDNDLFEFGDDLLKEAQRVGSSERVAVVAQQDPTSPGVPSRRGKIERCFWDFHRVGVTHGDAKAIIEFAQNVTNDYPADNKMLVLWDHGNGWQNVDVFVPLTDETPLAILDTLKALGDQHCRIALLCFDSCLMAMIEIAYQLREHVDFIVASENVVPADKGWPYDAMLTKLSLQPKITPRELACSIVDIFAGSYNASDQPITLSALDVAAVQPAVAAVDALSRELIEQCTIGGRDKVLFARRQTQSFGNPDYIDIVAFCKELLKQHLGAAVDAAATQVIAAVGKVVISATRGSAPSINGAHGLSIYFPDRPMSPLYQKLDFAKTRVCMWSTFLGMVATKVDPPRQLRRSGRARKAHEHPPATTARAKKKTAAR